MPANPLPPHPSLEQLRKRAKELRDLVRTGHPKFTEQVVRLHPRPPAGGWEGFSLADAQLVVARGYGFPSWRRLREHLEKIARYSRSPQRPPLGAASPVDDFLRLACLTYREAWRAGPGEEPDHPERRERARRLLAAHPELAAASIHTAAAAGDDAARAMLVADPALASQEGGPHHWPPLLYAAFSRVHSDPSTLDVFRLLLDSGADPNAGYLPDGEPPPVTALCGAFPGRDPVNQPAHRDGLELARLLLDAGADANDERALDHASRYPHRDGYLPLLLAHGLGRGPGGGPWRALLGSTLQAPAAMVEGEFRYAATMDLPDRVRLLLRHRDEIGFAIDRPEPKTPHDLAVLAGNTEVAALLRAAGARVRPLDAVEELVSAAMHGDAAAVTRLAGADPDLAARAVATDWTRSFHMEPLYQAALFDRPAAVRLLVSLGFPLNDRRGSPLHVAALAGHLDMARLLVELGADPTAEAIDDKTPGQFTPPDRTPAGWARYNGQHHVAAYLSAFAG